MEKHDLTLPLWGPYNKEYLGTAHVADSERGLRVDLNLFPGYYRRSVMCPRDLADCGAKMMASSVDLSHYRYRYELEWKDRVYIDADFCSEGRSMSIECRFVNNTDMPESLTLNALASMHSASQNHKEITDYRAYSPKGCIFVDAVDYAELKGVREFPRDGLRIGEKRESGFVNGRAISGKVMNTEAEIFYKIPATSTDKIVIYYKGEGEIEIKLGKKAYRTALVAAEKISPCVIGVNQGEISEFSVSYVGGAFDIDGFALGFEAENTDFRPAFDGFAPVVKSTERGAEIFFGEYGYEIKIDGAEFVTRTLYTDDPGQLLTASIHNHVSAVLKGGSDRRYTDFFIRPVFIEPCSEKTVRVTVTAKFGEDKKSSVADIYKNECNPEGKKYLLSQDIMSATTLTNVVFPIYCRGKYIRHNTPGRNWDSLYTWDSGFIGMGLSALDIKRAEDCLNAYLMPEDNSDAPFVLHGTPLPTQILLYSELVNKTGDKELAARYYGRIKAQYEFFSHQKANSPSGIFSLWHLFYNSGGWDDYPPQKQVHSEKNEASVSPVINTAFTLLCARILAPVARLLGEDDSPYTEDIKFFTDALNRYAWDEESGYYGYVEHGDGISIYRNNGVNADMGMDGAYPYIAGACDSYRASRVFDNILNGMMTEIGVSVVDTRAPYYSRSGYWNGSVWMPHQWILWKALLDYGEIELACEIAEKALSLWEREVSATYNCYEHFMIENGRGAGFHQFSGLSTPVLMWFESLYKPFNVTGGFRTLITDIRRENGGLSFGAHTDSQNATVIVCLDEGREYNFCCDAEIKRLNGGAYALIFKSPALHTVKITVI